MLTIKAPNMNDIKASIENLVRQECGAVIEWTLRGPEGFTISGKPQDVTKALPWFSRYRIESTVDDAELGERFVYLAF